MQSTILIVHIGIGILFTIVVLMQDKGVGFGTAVGGASGGAVFTTKRGAAKVLHRLSILLATLFLATALAYVVVPADEPEVTTGTENSIVPVSTTTSDGTSVTPSVE